MPERMTLYSRNGGNIGVITRTGGCHCGKVRFEVDSPERIEATECNCSICLRSGYLHLIVPVSRFRLLRGQEELQSYSFGTHTAVHLFCRSCGIKSFYRPRSHPDGISVNVRCLEGVSLSDLSITSFDGQQWEDNVHKLGNLPWK